MNKHTVLPIDVENGRIIFKNFSGVGSRYNREGDRNFNWVIEDPDLAQALTDDGWNVRVRPPREEGQEPEYRLQVTVSFRSFPNIPPAQIFTYSGRVKTQLSEDQVGYLDTAAIQSCDFTIRPRWWLDDETGEWHIKAYLKEMHVVLESSKWADKYAEYEAPEEAPFE